MGNASGYLKSATVDPDKLTDPTTGQVTVTFTADLMTSLPAGSYSIEVWVVDSTGTSIYPSDGSTGFTITNNIQSTNGATITTITFDDFVKAMNKAASTIAKGDKGDKGDTGTVDNAGLISAPAFQSLQNQVNNSAVGTNLLINTSSSATNGKTSLQGSANICGVYSRTDSYEQVTADPSYSELYYRPMVPLQNVLSGLTPGETYTLSGSVSYTSGELKFRSLYGTKGTDWMFPDTVIDLEIPVSDGSIFTPFSNTFTVPANATGTFISLQNYDYTAGGLFRFKNMKLEKGSVATNWCPNPSEILTQADYAKIKAAIVSLGGHLS